MSVHTIDIRVAMWASRQPDFETSVRDEIPVLYRVARRLVRSPEEAEDLVQQTLLKAFAAWKRFDGQHLRSWLIRILRNENLMKIRSEGTTTLVELNDDAGVRESFWNEVVWRDQADRILTELDTLPEEFRMTVQLCDIEQMSYEDAARAMDVPLGTIRSRLFRGRAQLRVRLTEEQ